MEMMEQDANFIDETQSSLFDRLSHETERVRVLALITLGTISVAPDNEIWAEVNSEQFLDRLLERTTDSSQRARMIVFTAFKNIIFSANEDMLSKLLSKNLLERFTEMMKNEPSDQQEKLVIEVADFLTSMVQDELIASTSVVQIQSSECARLIRASIDSTENHLL